MEFFKEKNDSAAGTQRRFNVHTTLFRRYRHWIDVETTLFACWEEEITDRVELTFIHCVI